MSKPQTKAGRRWSAVAMDFPEAIAAIEDEAVNRYRREQGELLVEHVFNPNAEPRTPQAVARWLASEDAERRLAAALHQWARRARTLEPNDEGIRAILAALRADDAD